MSEESRMVILCPEVKVALKFCAPVAEVNRSVEVFTFLTMKPISKPKKSARASKLALLLVRLLPAEVKLLNCIVVEVTVTFSTVIVSTKIVKLVTDAKKVVSVKDFRGMF